MHAIARWALPLLLLFGTGCTDTLVALGVPVRTMTATPTVTATAPPTATATTVRTPTPTSTPTPQGQPTATAQAQAAQPTPTGTILPNQVSVPAEPGPLSLPNLKFTQVEGGAAGGTGVVTVQTTPDEVCKIIHVFANGVSDEGASLRLKRPDSAGFITWELMHRDDAPVGTGSVTVACIHGYITTPFTLRPRVRP